MSSKFYVAIPSKLCIFLHLSCNALHHSLPLPCFTVYKLLFFFCKLKNELKVFPVVINNMLQISINKEIDLKFCVLYVTSEKNDLLEQLND